MKLTGQKAVGNVTVLLFDLEMTCCLLPKFYFYTPSMCFLEYGGPWISRPLQTLSKCNKAGAYFT